MGIDEVGTLRALKAVRRELSDPAIASHHGRVVKTTGDGILIEFPSVVDAVACAVAIQDGMVARNADVPEDRRIVFRIGINIGDIIIDEADIHGDGVNIAARLEGLAQPGCICLSGAAHDQVRGKLDLTFADLGEQDLKNIARPVRVYRVVSQTVQAASLSLGTSTSGQPERPALPLPDKPSLAVLPFQNMSGDPEQEYFADGMVEEIITALSRVKSFFVIARNSSFAYKGKSINVKQVARELGVRYVLEGSVRKAAGRVRITGQLIEAETGVHLWADRYEGGLDDVFELQDRVATSAVSAIAPKLQQAEIGRALRKRTADLSAYDLLLRALPNVWSFTPEGNAAALDLLSQAVEIDREYAYAYSLAAWCIRSRIFQAWPSWCEDQEQISLRWARKAISLDRDDPGVLWASAEVLGFANRDPEYMLDLTERALSIDPNCALAWAIKGYVCNWLGRHDEGIEAFENAIRLSPLDPMSFLFFHGIGECHSYARRYERAVEWYSRALREHTAPIAQRGLAIAYAHLGRLEEARGLVMQVMRATPDFTITKWRQFTVRRGADQAFGAEGYRLAGFPE
jgi:adenylate cyclase